METTINLWSLLVSSLGPEDVVGEGASRERALAAVLAAVAAGEKVPENEVEVGELGTSLLGIVVMIVVVSICVTMRLSDVEDTVEYISQMNR